MMWFHVSTSDTWVVFSDNVVVTPVVSVMELELRKATIVRIYCYQLPTEAEVLYLFSLLDHVKTIIIHDGFMAIPPTTRRPPLLKELKMDHTDRTDEMLNQFQFMEPELVMIRNLLDYEYNEFAKLINCLLTYTKTESITIEVPLAPLARWLDGQRLKHIPQMTGRLLSLVSIRSVEIHCPECIRPGKGGIRDNVDILRIFASCSALDSCPVDVLYKFTQFFIG